MGHEAYVLKVHDMTLIFSPHNEFTLFFIKKFSYIWIPRDLSLSSTLVNEHLI